MSKRLLRKSIFALLVFSSIVLGNAFKQESLAQTPVKWLSRTSRQAEGSSSLGLQL